MRQAKSKFFADNQARLNLARIRERLYHTDSTKKAWLTPNLRHKTTVVGLFGSALARLADAKNPVPLAT
jgi:hypothetical protein